MEPISVGYKCGRCYTVLPSLDGARAPTTCLLELGGCGRTTEVCEGHEDPENAKDCDICVTTEKYGHTRMFQGDWGDAKIQLVYETELGSEGRILFTRLVETWEHYIEFGNPWHPRILSLFQFQSYFYKSLPAVFYVGLTGPSGSAKTTVLEILRDTCYNGILTGDASVSAISRKLDQGCTMLLDEADEIDKDKKELVFAAARRGYRPGNVYLRTLYEGKGKSNFEEIKTYGPKAFSFLTDIESALKSRTVEIPTIRVKQDPFGKVLGNLARGPGALSGLRTDLAAYSTQRLKEWPQDAIGARLESHEFRQKIEGAVGKEVSPRDIEVTAICLLIADVADVEISEDARTAMESQAMFEDESTSELVNYVKDTWGGRQYVKLKELREGFNRTKKDVGEKPIHHKRFRAILREIGLRDGEELKRKSGEGNHILLFTEHAKKVLSLDGSHGTVKKGFGWFTEAVDASRDGSQPTLDVKNQRERVLFLREVSKALCGGGENSFFTLGDLVKSAMPVGISELDVEHFLKRETEQGKDIYEPEPGQYRWVKS